MNILYVVNKSLEINTSSSIRNRATIKGMLQLGHTVYVLTPLPDYDHPNYERDINIAKDDKFNLIYIKPNVIEKIKKYARKLFNSNLINKMYGIKEKNVIYDYNVNIRNSLKVINRLNIKFDFIVSSSDPKSSHLHVLQIISNTRFDDIPWIQIWGDPFLLDITRKNHNLNDIILKEEKRLLNSASSIIYVSKMTYQSQAKMYTSYSDKMHYVPIPYLNKILYPAFNNDEKLFLYTGDYSKSIRNILPLCDAINKTKHKMIICGNSDVVIKNTKNIKVYGRINYNKVIELEKKSDILVSLSNRKGTQIPGKLYQYSGTNKPILYILDGEIELIRNQYEQYNRYIMCENNEHDILKQIEKIQKCGLEEKYKPVPEFDPEFIAKKILSTVKI